VTPLEIESTERMARALRWAWYGMWIRSAYPPQIVTPPWLAPEPPEWLRMNTRDWLLLRPPTPADSAALYAEISKTYAEHARRTRNARLVETTDQTMDAIRRAEGDIRRLATCPLRGCTKRVSFEARGRNTFHCRCADCGGQWGTRICGSCHQQFPVLWVKNAVGAGQNGDQIDATFGSEVLALPCPAFPDWKRFRCPWCNICQGAPACHCS
jgi:hypothetical protein